MKLQNTFVQSKMNKDIDERLLPKGQYPHAENIRIANSDGSDVGALENVKGNEKLTNLALVNATTIGAISDGSNEKLYWFITSDNKDLVVEYDVSNSQTNVVLQSTKPNGVLNFNKNSLITGVSKIINGDSKRDLLVWTDDINPIRVANIERAKTYGLDGFIEEDISLIKNPPRYAPLVVLTYTPNTLDNNIENKFLSFSYRYKYLDGGYSALSSFTNYAFSPSKFDLDYQTMENKGMKNSFNAVRIDFNTGDKRVTDVELVYKEAGSNTLYLIEAFNKVNKLWNDSEVQSFVFSSNKSLVALPEDELFRSYDNVPRLAKSLEVVGSRLVFGNYVEQYDLINSSGNSINIDYSLSLINKSLVGVSIPVTRTIIDTGVIDFDLSSQDLKRNSKIVIDIKIENYTNTGIFEDSFDFIMDKDYATVAELSASSSFEYFVEVIMTETFKSNYTISNVPANSVIESIRGFLLLATNSPNLITIQAPRIVYRVDDTPTNTADNPTNTHLETARFYYAAANTVLFKETSVDSSLKTNRSNEVGIIYLDSNSRATTVQTSDTNTVYVDQRYSTSQNKIVVNINHEAPYWADRYKLVVKQNKTNYQTIYTNQYYRDGVYAWFLLQGTNKNKVKEGDTLIIKNANKRVYNTITKLQVLEVESKVRDFIEDNVDSDGNDIIETSGLYFKVRVEDFYLDGVGSRSYNDEAGAFTRNSTLPICYLDLFSEGSSGAIVDLAIKAGSRITFKFNSSFNYNSGWSYHKYEKTFTTLEDYNDLEEWYDNNILNISLKDEHEGDEAPHDYKDNMVIRRGTPDSPSDGKLYLQVQGHENAGSGGRNGYVTAEIAVSTTDEFFIFETEPQDSNSELFYETEQTFEILNGLHQGNVENQTLLSPTAVIEMDYYNCYVQGNGAESYRYKDAYNVGTDALGNQVLANYLNIDLRPTAASIEEYKEVRRFADLTYSEPYNENSNLNGLGVFNLSRANYKEDMDKRYGFIQKLYARDTNLLVFQEDKVSKVLYGKDLLMNADGSSNVSSVEEVLGQQIAYEGEYGISRNPESFTYDAFNLYFADAKRGCVCRLGRNGITEISMAGMRSYFKDTFEASINNKKIGGYDPYVDQFVLHTSSSTLNSPITMDCSETVSKSGIIGELVITMDFGLSSGDSGFNYSVTEGSIDMEVVWNNTVVETLTGQSGSGTVVFNKNLLSPNTATIRINSTSCASFEIVGTCPVVGNITIINLVLGNTSFEGLTRNSRYRWVSGTTFSSIKSYPTTFDSSVVDNFDQVLGKEGIGSVPLTGSTIILDSYKSINETGSFLAGDRLGYLVSDTEYSENSYQTILGNTTFLNTQEETTVAGDVISTSSFVFNRPNNEQYLYLIWDYTNKNQAPVANNDTASVDSGETIIINVLANDTDVEGGALTPVIVTNPQHGSVVINSDGTISYTNNDSGDVADSFTYYVSDGTDGSNTATVSIGVIQNEAPVAINDTASVDSGETVIINVLANDTDADGDTLTPTIVTNPQHGSVVINSDGTISYTSNGTSTEVSDSFTYTVSDGKDTSNVATVSIDVIQNEAPVANNDTASVVAGGTAVISVLNNDTDADGDTLTPTIVTNPQYGVVVVNNNGTISYTHDGSNQTLDSFTYYVSDGTVNSNTATVNIGIGISAGSSISASGSAGVYLVPFIIGTEAGEFIAHFNAFGVPDRFQILFDVSGVSNNLSDMEIVADSLFVGDGVANDSSPYDYPVNGTIGSLNLHTYNGSSFDITDSVVVSNQGSRSNLTPNGVSRNSSGGAQLGVQNKVYTTSSDTVGSEGLNYGDGNIAIKYDKAASTSFRAYIRVYGVTSTAWDLYQTEFII